MLNEFGIYNSNEYLYDGGRYLRYESNEHSGAEFLVGKEGIIIIIYTQTDCLVLTKEIFFQYKHYHFYYPLESQNKTVE